MVARKPTSRAALALRYALLAGTALVVAGWGTPPAQARLKKTSATAPADAVIPGLLKPVVLKRVLEDREVMTHASLESAPVPPRAKPAKGAPELQRYSFYAAMLVDANVKTTRQILTDYKLYEQMISYVDKARYSPASHVLQIEGGIWRFRLVSSILFHEAGPNLIEYRIIAGHFRGLTGQIRFEPRQEKGTLVYLGGALEGAAWPPKWVIERGAEVVFGFTGKKMRSYIESRKENQNEEIGSEKAKLPQPRSRI